MGAQWTESELSKTGISHLTLVELHQIYRENAERKLCQDVVCLTRIYYGKVGVNV